MNEKGCDIANFKFVRRISRRRGECDGVLDQSNDNSIHLQLETGLLRAKADGDTNSHDLARSRTSWCHNELCRTLWIQTHHQIVLHDDINLIITP